MLNSLLIEVNSLFVTALINLMEFILPSLNELILQLNKAVRAGRLMISTADFSEFYRKTK